MTIAKYMIMWYQLWWNKKMVSKLASTFKSYDTIALGSWISCAYHAHITYISYIYLSYIYHAQISYIMQISFIIHYIIHHISYIYHTYIIHISCRYHADIIYHTYIIHISYIYHTHIIHISYIYHTYIIHISYIYHTYITYHTYIMGVSCIWQLIKLTLNHGYLFANGFKTSKHPRQVGQLEGRGRGPFCCGQGRRWNLNWALQWLTVVFWVVTIWWFNLANWKIYYKWRF